MSVRAHHVEVGARREPRPVELLERDLELGRLRRAISDAAGDCGGGVLIEGPAGIGKTALLGASMDHARASGFLVLRARCAELEQPFAFGVARQLFEAPLAGLGAAAHRAVFAGAAELAAPLFDGGSAREVQARGGDRAYALVHGLFWLASNFAAADPLVIAVDDAQWADPPSSRFLAYLARRLEGSRVALLLTARPRSAVVAALDSELSSSVGVLELPPLGARSVATLVRTALPGADGAFCAACHRASAGNPYFLRELLGQVRADGVSPTAQHADRVARLRSTSIARTVLARLVGLGEDASALASAAAVLDTGAELRHVAVLSGLDQVAAARAADVLSAADILAAGRLVQFAHPIVRESIYAAIAVSERAVMHTRAAALLAEDGVAARAATHLLLGEPAGDAGAVEILVAAAREAMSRGAAEIGASYLRRALSEPPDAARRSEVLLELGRAEARTGDAVAGFGLIAEALELTSDPVMRAKIALELGRGLVVIDRASEAIDVFDRARRALDGSTPELVDRLEAERAGAGLVDLSIATATLARLRRIPAAAERDSRGRRQLLAYSAFALAAGGGSADQAAARAERALADDKLMGEGTLVALCFAAFTLAFCDRFDAALDAFHRALDVARQRGSHLMFVLCSWGCAHVQYRRGSLSDSEAHARSSIDAGLEAWFTASVGVLADVLVERGALDQAADAYRTHALEGELWPDLLMSNFLLSSRGRLRCAAGDPQAALADQLCCGRRLTGAGIGNPAIITWRSDAALAHVALEDFGQARRLVREELELARRFGAPRAIGIASRTAGLIEARAGNTERALELLSDAAAALLHSGARLEYARALVEHGAALRRAGARVSARELLRDGMDLASQCESSMLTDRGRQELIAAGARPRRERISGTDSLTASERRVAKLAADGNSNREIAQALFITMNTVGKHLTHIYGKLDIEDRTQLSPALAERDNGLRLPGPRSAA